MTYYQHMSTTQNYKQKITKYREKIQKLEDLISNTNSTNQMLTMTGGYRDEWALEASNIDHANGYLDDVAGVVAADRVDIYANHALDLLFDYPEVNEQISIGYHVTIFNNDPTHPRSHITVSLVAYRAGVAVSAPAEIVARRIKLRYFPNTNTYSFQLNDGASMMVAQFLHGHWQNFITPRPAPLAADKA